MVEPLIVGGQLLGIDADAAFAEPDPSRCICAIIIAVVII
jgi:hypothetical protein